MSEDLLGFFSLMLIPTIFGVLNGMDLLWKSGVDEISLLNGFEKLLLE